jgi:hypothetical protein
MASKKRSSKRTTARKKTMAPKKMIARKRTSGPRAKTGRRRKAAGEKAPGKRRVGKKTKGAPATGRTRGRAGSALDTPSAMRGLGPEAGGQSGDTEGLSRAELADSESVEELLEEGQAFEAGVVSGVENAPEADKGGVRTRQVPEDDVPQEYLDED